MKLESSAAFVWKGHRFGQANMSLQNAVTAPCATLVQTSSDDGGRAARCAAKESVGTLFARTWGETSQKKPMPHEILIAIEEGL